MNAGRTKEWDRFGWLFLSGAYFCVFVGNAVASARHIRGFWWEGEVWDGQAVFGGICAAIFGMALARVEYLRKLADCSRGIKRGAIAFCAFELLLALSPWTSTRDGDQTLEGMAFVVGIVGPWIFHRVVMAQPEERKD